MLQCLFIKRKFFEYCEGKLSEHDKKKVERHIASCTRCRELIETVGTIERAQEDVPKQSETFWHNFTAELHHKLDKRIAKKLWVTPFPIIRFKPAVVFATAAVIILAFLFLMPRFQERAAFGPLVSTPDALIEEILLLEDVTDEAMLNHDEDAYLDELALFYELDQEVG